MKYYIIAGEASGDMHGAKLMQALKEVDSAATFRFWGGDMMVDQDPNIVKHIRDLAFMGFVEVVKHLGTILGNISFCKKDIQAFRPDALILIDYPGFNMRIAKWARKQGLKVIYYISPQLWAWKEGRVKAIKRDVDKMLVILPFEEAFYARHDFPVTYVGHPLTDRIKELSPIEKDKGDNRPTIALLPGSRKQEIASKLPIMLSVVPYYPEYDFILIKAPAIEVETYASLIQGRAVKLVEDLAYTLRRQCSMALVTSGTATLETALLGVPQIVCYKGNKLSYRIAKRLIKVKYISLVNLILDKPAVKELIQDDLNTENLRAEMDLLLFDNERKEAISADYRHLWQLLNKDNASQNAAHTIYQYLLTNAPH